MKKIIAASALALMAGSALAAGTAVTNGLVIQNGTCTYVPASNTAGVKLSISSNIVAVYECTPTGVVTGAAHMQGKKHGYISTSAGGSQQQADMNANPTDATTLNADSQFSSKWTAAVGQLT